MLITLWLRSPVRSPVRQPARRSARRSVTSSFAEEQENIEEQPKQERAAGKEVSSNTQPIAPDGIFTEKGELFSTFHDQIYREANMFEMEVDELLEIFLNAA